MANVLRGGEGGGQAQWVTTVTNEINREGVAERREGQVEARWRATPGSWHLLLRTAGSQDRPGSGAGRFSPPLLRVCP